MLTTRRAHVAYACRAHASGAARLVLALLLAARRAVGCGGALALLQALLAQVPGSCVVQVVLCMTNIATCWQDVFDVARVSEARYIVACENRLLREEQACS